MKRTVSVTATCSFEYEIDDEVVSEWDGSTILDVLERRRANEPPVYTSEATMDDLLGHLGIQLSVNNRRINVIDGWADFPAEAAKGWPYSPDWSIEDVHVSGVREVDER